MQVMEPGNYAVVCFVEGTDHVPHMAKGMMKSLTVTPSPNANMTEPAADVQLTLDTVAPHGVRAELTFTIPSP